MSILTDKLQCQEDINNWVRVAKYDLGWPDASIIAQMSVVMAGFRGIELHDHSCYLQEILNRRETPCEQSHP